MLYIEEAIEQLSDCCDRGSVTFDDKFKKAVRMGKKALTLLAYDKSHRLSDASLQLLLDAERRDDDNSTRHRAENLRGDQ